MASVNYYFGGKEGLYEAVLIEAHRQIISLEEIEALVQTEADTGAQLRVVLAHLLGMSTRPIWGLKVVVFGDSAGSCARWHACPDAGRRPVRWGHRLPAVATVWDLFPGHFQFFGHQHRQAGVNALSHLQMFDQYGDGVIRRDPQKSIWSQPGAAGVSTFK